MTTNFNDIRGRLKAGGINGSAPKPPAPPAKAGPFKVAVKPAEQRQSLFAGVEHAKDLGEGGDFCKHGRYIARVGKCTIKKTRKGDEPAIIDLQIVHVIDNKQGTGHQLGDETADYIKNIGAAKDYFLPSIRNFVSSVFGVETNQLTQAACDAVFDENQAASGGFIEWKGEMRPFKDKPGFFTKVTFLRPVSAREVYGLIAEDTRARLFPDQELERLVQAEDAENGGEAVQEETVAEEVQ